jgi:recombination protein RecA
MEVSGPNNSGKTTLCAQIAAETQALGGIVVVTDTEERIDDVYWSRLGVDVSRILRIKATDLKDVFEKQYRALQFARTNAADRLVLLLWDSLGGTAGAEQLDENAKENIMEQAEKFGMRRAKVISDGMEAINTIVTKTRASYLYTNHEYTKIGTSYGSPRETRGGNKPKYFATVRLQLTPVGQIKDADPVGGRDRVIGQRVRVKALKNSMAGFLLERDAVIMAGRGFVNEYTVFDVGVRLGVISQAGSWYTWVTPKGETVKFQGYGGFETTVVPHAEYDDLLAAVEGSM